MDCESDDQFCINWAQRNLLLQEYRIAQDPIKMDVLAEGLVRLMFIDQWIDRDLPDLKELDHDKTRAWLAGKNGALAKLDKTHQMHLLGAIRFMEQSALKEQFFTYLGSNPSPTTALRSTIWDVYFDSLYPHGSEDRRESYREFEANKSYDWGIRKTKQNKLQAVVLPSLKISEQGEALVLGGGTVFDAKEIGEELQASVCRDKNSDAYGKARPSTAKLYAEMQIERSMYEYASKYLVAK